MHEKRKTPIQREVFDTVLSNLSALLPCYNKEAHYSVIVGYLKAYNIYLQDSAKSRLLYMLGAL